MNFIEMVEYLNDNRTASFRPVGQSGSFIAKANTGAICIYKTGEYSGEFLKLSSVVLNADYERVKTSKIVSLVDALVAWKDGKTVKRDYNGDSREYTAYDFYVPVVVEDVEGKSHWFVIE